MLTLEEPEDTGTTGRTPGPVVAQKPLWPGRTRTGVVPTGRCQSWSPLLQPLGALDQREIDCIGAGQEGRIGYRIR